MLLLALTLCALCELFLIRFIVALAEERRKGAPHNRNRGPGRRKQAVEFTEIGSQERDGQKSPGIAARITIGVPASRLKA